MASCFALTCNACANILRSLVNKTWGHVEVLNKRSTQALCHKSMRKRHRRQAVRDLHAPLPPVCLDSSAPLWFPLRRRFLPLKKKLGGYPAHFIIFNELLISKSLTIENIWFNVIRETQLVNDCLLSVEFVEKHKLSFFCLQFYLFFSI